MLCCVYDACKIIREEQLIMSLDFKKESVDQSVFTEEGKEELRSILATRECVLVMTVPGYTFMVAKKDRKSLVINTTAQKVPTSGFGFACTNLV